MANLDSYVDWTGCELLEQIPDKVSGRPTVRGTRILADAIAQDVELGSPLEEIHENYPDLFMNAIQQLISLLARTRTATRVRVLFDHNLPHELRTNLGTLGMHEIITTSYMDGVS